VTGRVDYDEFGLFGENAAEYGLPFDRPPTVRRAFASVPGGRRLSALVWQQGEPELVLLHGGAQNAHTWDTVAMALGRPLVAIDLPGHGHSGIKAERAQHITDFVNGPASFASPEELLERTARFNPARTRSSLRLPPVTSTRRSVSRRSTCPCPPAVVHHV
jgi:pimeloyl-ACP methyl ester carboxylesterase